MSISQVVVDRGWATDVRTNDGRRMTARLYQVWSGIKQRCDNPRKKCWSRYGGRGIAMCPSWRSYSEFRKWAVSSGYKKGLQIDRIDNNGNYEPKNCRWVVQTENLKNRESYTTRPPKGVDHANAKLTEQNVIDIRRAYAAGGITHKELAKAHGVSRRTIGEVVNLNNWKHIEGNANG